MSYTIDIHERRTYYEFGELCKSAQDTAVEQLLQDPYFFWSDIEAEKSWTVDEYFTLETRPEWQGDFSFTQGDGLNLYGDLLYSELRNAAGLDPIDEDITIEFPSNRRYTYSLWNITYPDVLRDALEWNEIEFEESDVAAICETMDRYCAELYRYGEWLIIEGYCDASVFDGQLFDEFGNFAFHIDELESIEKTA